MKCRQDQSLVPQGVTLSRAAARLFCQAVSNSQYTHFLPLLVNACRHMQYPWQQTPGHDLYRCEMHAKVYAAKHSSLHVVWVQVH